MTNIWKFLEKRLSEEQLTRIWCSKPARLYNIFFRGANFKNQLKRGPNKLIDKLNLLDFKVLNFLKNSDTRLFYKKKYWSSKVCRVESKGEMYIANWLYDHKIRFIYEPKLILGENIYYPDFYLPRYKHYIEFWGFAEHEIHGDKYKVRMKAKKKKYKQYNIEYISVYASQVSSLKNFEQTFPVILDDKLGTNFQEELQTNACDTGSNTEIESKNLFKESVMKSMVMALAISFCVIFGGFIFFSDWGTELAGQWFHKVDQTAKEQVTFETKARNARAEILATKEVAKKRYIELATLEYQLGIQKQNLAKDEEKYENNDRQIVYVNQVLAENPNSAQITLGKNVYPRQKVIDKVNSLITENNALELKISSTKSDFARLERGMAEAKSNADAALASVKGRISDIEAQEMEAKILATTLDMRKKLRAMNPEENMLEINEDNRNQMALAEDIRKMRIELSVEDQFDGVSDVKTEVIIPDQSSSTSSKLSAYMNKNHPVKVAPAPQQAPATAPTPVSPSNTDSPVVIPNN